MTPKELLLAAATSIEEVQHGYACIALKDLSGYYRDSSRDRTLWLECEFAYFTAFGKFMELYRPMFKHEGGAWFTGPDCQEQRVAALKATAATFS